MQEFLLRPETKRSERTNNKNHSKNNLNGDIASKTNGFPVFDKKSQKSSDAIAEPENGIATIAYTRGLNENSSTKRIHSSDNAEKYIRFENAMAVWELSETRQMNGIFDMNLEIKPGLCAIVGQVGSSKSTLLNVILGELALDAGSLEVSGSVSYAAQEPWIFEGSVRNNIVFVDDFDEERYDKVIEVCALERDLKLLPQGDRTIVGEQGSSLSGGQKARVK